MRVLVTGASGFIGSHMVSTLLERGDEVVALVRPKSDRSALRRPGIQLVEGDILEPKSLASAVRDVDAVIHLASLLKMPWVPEFRTINEGGTSNVAMACRDAPTRPTLVVVSSLAAAGPARLAARRETEKEEPVSVYGRVKLAAEQCAARYAADVPISIVRPPMVFGEGDRTTLKLFRSIKGGIHVVPTRARNHVSLVHARDLAEGMIRVCEVGERVPPNPVTGAGVYHLAAAESVEYGDFARLFADAMGCRTARVLRVPAAMTGVTAALNEGVARLRRTPTVLNLDKYREATAGSWTCSIEKARRELDYAPPSLSSRIAQTVAWYRSQGWL